jgi:hypothetical protein
MSSIAGCNTLCHMRDFSGWRPARGPDANSKYWHVYAGGMFCLCVLVGAFVMMAFAGL